MDIDIDVDVVRTKGPKHPIFEDSGTNGFWNQETSNIGYLDPLGKVWVWCHSCQDPEST